jgi:hypothetical protein
MKKLFIAQNIPHPDDVQLWPQLTAPGLSALPL